MTYRTRTHPIIGDGSAPVRVAHVIATGRRRGAELFVHDLVRGLHGLVQDQLVVILREPVELQFEAETVLIGSRRRGVPGIHLDLAAVRRLRRQLRAWAPDVIQACGGESLKYTVASAGGRMTTPILYRKIGEADPRIRTGPRRLAYSALMRRAHSIVGVADAIGREAVDVFGLPLEQVVTLQRGIDPARMVPTIPRPELRASIDVPPDVNVILSLGALSWEKNPLAHLEVSRRLRARGVETFHVFAGDGPLRAELEAAVDGNGERPWVRILGSRPDVADLLGASDVLLLASYTEGLPGCVMEAGFAGVAVAAYGVGGVPSLVVDGVTGRLVAPGDLDELTQATEELLTDPVARQRMQEAARSECRRRFDVSAVAPAYAKLFNDVTERKEDGHEGAPRDRHRSTTRG